MHRTSSILAGRLALIVAGLSITTALGGCTQDAPATFQPGSGANPLDGGVISNDGRMMQLNLTPDGTALASVSIDGGESTIEFGPPSGGVAVPREIETSGGESSLSVDRDSEEVTINAVAPLGIGPISLTDELPQELTVTREFLLPDDRSGAQAASCQTVVDSVNEFCDLYLANRDASIEEVTEFATGIAERELGNNAANGFVESLVRQYYDVLDTFCDGFKELVEPEEGDPTDLCAS